MTTRESKESMEIIECDICGKSFGNKRSLGNHRRWHNLPEYKDFQSKFKKKISEKLRERIITEDWRVKISKTKRKQNLINEKNHNWKGDNVGYKCLHDWVRKYKTKPKLCPRCGLEKKLDIHNISGLYKRDLSDWIYLCRRCHKIIDGTLRRFVVGGEKTRLKKGHKNEMRWKK